MKYKFRNWLNGLFQKKIPAKQTLLVILLVGLTLFGWGLHMFWTGFHNFDSSQNYQSLENSINLYFCRNNLSELNIDIGESFVDDMELVELDPLYSLGIRQTFDGLFLMIPGLLLIGLFIGAFISTPTGKGK